MANSVEVKPINTKEYDGKTVTDRYDYDKVHVQDIPGSFSQKNVDIKKGKSHIRWQYSGKCPILIGEDEVLAKGDAPKKEARNQAYFALSILSDAGYVSRFRKKQ